MSFVLGPYAAVLRTPGAVAFSGSALLARLPMSMLGLAIVFAVEASTGRYGQAGVVSGACLLGQAAGAPLQARLADRWGQTRLLLPVLAAHGTALGAFTLLVSDQGMPVLVVLAVAAGITLPSFGSLVRARWARLHTGTPSLQTAYALESVLDEVVFVFGPPLVTMLATVVAPRSGLLCCLALTLTGGVLYALQRRTDPGPRPARLANQVVAARFPVFMLTWIGVTFVFMGAIFGSVEVTTVAFTEEAGSPGAAGVVLAAYSLGSLIAGLAAGTVRWRSGPRRRFLIGQAVLAVAMLPMPWVSTPVLLGVLMFLAGFAIAPTLIAGFSLVESEVPAPRLTEGLAWVSTALSAGVAGGAAVSGPIIDGPGPSAAFGVPVAAGVLATVLCIIGLSAERRSRARRAPAEAGAS